MATPRRRPKECCSWPEPSLPPPASARRCLTRRTAASGAQSGAEGACRPVCEPRWCARALPPLSISLSVKTRPSRPRGPWTVDGGRKRRPWRPALGLPTPRARPVRGGGAGTPAVTTSRDGEHARTGCHLPRPPHHHHDSSLDSPLPPRQVLTRFRSRARENTMGAEAPGGGAQVRMLTWWWTWEAGA